MTSLQAFSWGYWGWGTHTKKLVDTVGSIERSRGKRPPVFVDIRFHRSGRAPGFVGSAFEETVGKNRYVWLRKLGNERIGSGRGGIKIADMTGIDDLLLLIAEKHEQHRRVIFFCGCQLPCRCHRRVVSKLLVRSAARKGIRLSVSEWPGDEPKTVVLSVQDGVVKNILRGGKRVPLDGLNPKKLREFVSLPWASRVALCSDEGGTAIVSGPAQLGKSWYLPVIGPETIGEMATVRSLAKEASRAREELGYSPLRT